MSNNYFSPKEENKNTDRLLKLIGSEYIPEQVPIIPEEYSEFQNCFGNVDKKIKKDGGYVHYGWAIFQSKILCEGERHAVWESEDGELIDITPREDKMDEIMFVSDPDFEYTGQVIDNYRINITNNKLVNDFIKVCEHLSKLYNLGERRDDYTLNVDTRLGKMIYEYEKLKSAIQIHIESGNNERSKCVCGGPKNYKNCHQKIILSNMPKDYREIVNVLQE